MKIFFFTNARPMLKVTAKALKCVELRQIDMYINVL